MQRRRTAGQWSVPGNGNGTLELGCALHRELKALCRDAEFDTATD
ncbi:MAG: hypothetical protein OXB95_04265 [Rhodobacteraceae bacterium]|nr:hypothetical protein [Paracoccaceae bacterium]